MFNTEEEDFRIIRHDFKLRNTGYWLIEEYLLLPRN